MTSESRKQKDHKAQGFLHVVVWRWHFWREATALWFPNYSTQKKGAWSITAVNNPACMWLMHGSHLAYLQCIHTREEFRVCRLCVAQCADLSRQERQQQFTMQSYIAGVHERTMYALYVLTSQRPACYDILVCF